MRSPAPALAVRTSRTLMAASVLATALVVSIHYNSRAEALALGRVRDWSYLLQEFFTNGVARVAVPYFALVAGFFYARSSLRRRYTAMLREKARTLLLPYLLAAALIFLGFGLLAARHHDLAYFTPRHILRALTVAPESVQFWYLRDLLVLVVVSPLLGARVQRLTIWHGVVAAVLGLLWLLDIQFMPMVAGWYLLNVETLFFFYAGCLLSARGGWLDRLVNASARSTLLVLAAWLALLVVRVALAPTLDVWYVRHYTLPTLLLYKAAIGLGVVSLIQLSGRLQGQRWLIGLSGLTFFVFLFHCEPLRTLIGRTLSPLHLGAERFYLAFPLALAVSFGAGALLARAWPWLYALLTGSRSPDTALRRGQVQGEEVVPGAVGMDERASGPV